ncbi:MAG: tRNA (adenosine(37)-N6)-dimethylallyltransferase MiaA, partial [Bacteroidia bacterium]|nr:tRNA (adenosine(37)-N6)-dimethylallyltransferase MiaA [Bacteroidia bacterium]
MNDPGPLLVIVTGPTAIGKTRVSIHLAKVFSTEIISCDSRQFYQELNIGVARPSKEELASVPHHLIGCRSIQEAYNVYQFETDVLALCAKLFAKQGIVIMTGGSGLYVHAINQGIDEQPDPDPALREQLKKELQEER